VTARARQCEEVGRAQQRQPPVLAERDADESLDRGNGGDAQVVAGEASDHDEHQQQIRSQNPSDQSNDFLANGSLEPAPDFQGQQIDEQPSQPATSLVPLNTSSLQHIPDDGSQALAGGWDTTVLQHDGCSIFNQMMNSLIAAGTAENLQYRQVRLPPNTSTRTNWNICTTVNGRDLTVNCVPELHNDRVFESHQKRQKWHDCGLAGL
jgi:hypothetical protein